MGVMLVLVIDCFGQSADAVPSSHVLSYRYPGCFSELSHLRLQCTFALFHILFPSFLLISRSHPSRTTANTQARREHGKTHDGACTGCTECTDYASRGKALLGELEAMDKTLREMEDAVMEDVRDFKAARRREKRHRERNRKRAGAGAGGSGSKEKAKAKASAAEVRQTAAVVV
jgi:hypothetical protein